MRRRKNPGVFVTPDGRAVDFGSSSFAREVKGITSKREWRAWFRRKSFEIHPDLGGSTEAMRRLLNFRDTFERSAAYEVLPD